MNKLLRAWRASASPDAKTEVRCSPCTSARGGWRVLR
jgi:hypothetical protein